jgi:putative transport protein
LLALNTTQFIPVFIGLALGVLAGSLPISVPGLASPLKLGLAGGPLVVAILLSRLGRVGPLVWHMPANTNLAFRELGIAMFLACVGLSAGPKFFSTVMSHDGLIWAGAALVVSMVPLLVAGIIGRRWMRLNFLVLSGLLTGSMTDPPALAFANGLAKSDAPSIAYATVYPATMLARILMAQVMVLLFF